MQNLSSLSSVVVFQKQSKVRLFYYPLYDLSNNSLIVISNMLAEMISLNSICHKSI